MVLNHDVIIDEKVPFSVLGLFKMTDFLFERFCFSDHQEMLRVGTLHQGSSSKNKTLVRRSKVYLGRSDNFLIAWIVLFKTYCGELAAVQLCFSLCCAFGLNLDGIRSATSPCTTSSKSLIKLLLNWFISKGFIKTSEGLGADTAIKPNEPEKINVYVCQSWNVGTWQFF